MSTLPDMLALLLLAAGVMFFLAGTVGLLRFPDTASRLHALTKADNLGLGLVVLALLRWAPDLAHAAKLLVVWALVLLSGGTAAQMIAERLRGPRR